MNKGELVSQIAQVVGSKKQATLALNCVLQHIIESLRAGDEVKLSGLGAFKVSKRKARAGVNPRTGEPIRIEEKMVPKFVPAEALKDAVNGGA